MIITRRQFIAALALAAIPLIVVLMGHVVRQEFDRDRTLRSAVDHSYQARAQLQRVLSLHQDIETGQRGYVLTGDARFLDPYRQAQSRIRGEVAVLPAIKGGFPSGELDALRQLSTAKLDFAEQTIRLRSAGETGKALAMISSGRGKLLMDRIRSRIAGLDATEAGRLKQRTRAADEARLRTQRLIYGLQAMLALLLFLAAMTTARTMSARRRALSRLEDLSARQSAILESAKDGIITLNPSGSIENLNGAAAQMFGYGPAELVRRDVGILFEIAPDQGRVESFLKRLRLAGEGGRIQEFWGRRKNGQPFPCEVAISPMQLSDGVHYVAIIRDVTERKQVEQMKSEFVSTVSHELRTPLTSIAGSLGLLSGGAAGALPEKAARLITIAQSNCERLVRLINDILDIEKIESGKMRFEARSLPLPEFLEQAVQANQGFADEAGVALRLQTVPQDSSVMADPDRLMQVMTNLISNAVKFSQEGAAVTIAVSALQRRYRITVADRGSGIPEEFRSRIFGKFAQADSTDARQKGGTGLGLSIVKEIVARLGGTVSFESGPDGTSFHVDLPAVDPDPGMGAGAAPGAQAISSGMSVLHVDDDPDMLRLVADAFDGSATVHSSPSVQEAKAAIDRFRFDAVILDIGMADGCGLDLLPSLKGKRDTAVVIFTAQDPDPERVADADALLTKSRASLQQLVTTVMELAERSGKVKEQDR